MVFNSIMGFCNFRKIPFSQHQQTINNYHCFSRPPLVSHIFFARFGIPDTRLLKYDFGFFSRFGQFCTLKFRTLQDVPVLEIVYQVSTGFNYCLIMYSTPLEHTQGSKRLTGVFIDTSGYRNVVEVLH